MLKAICIKAVYVGSLICRNYISNELCLLCNKIQVFGVYIQTLRLTSQQVMGPRSAI